MPAPAALTETTQEAIGDKFKEFTTNDDISVILISQEVRAPVSTTNTSSPRTVVPVPLADPLLALSRVQIAGQIRWLIDEFESPVPSILEIPTKSKPYDPEQDPTYERIKRLLGGID